MEMHAQLRAVSIKIVFSLFLKSVFVFAKTIMKAYQVTLYSRRILIGSRINMNVTRSFFIKLSPYIPLKKSSPISRVLKVSLSPLVFSAITIFCLHFNNERSEISKKKFRPLKYD